MLIRVAAAAAAAVAVAVVAAAGGGGSHFVPGCQLPPLFIARQIVPL